MPEVVATGLDLTDHVKRLRDGDYLRVYKIRKGEMTGKIVEKYNDLIKAQIDKEEKIKIVKGYATLIYTSAALLFHKFFKIYILFLLHLSANFYQ